jgi:tetratricopeptide (TPR) repeat protein
VPSGGMPTEQSVRFRVGDVPPFAEGFSDRPDTARGILDALVPGSTIALVPGSEFAEGKQNWLGASGKTQIAVMLAETLWRSGAVDIVVWISATSRSAVLSGYVEAWAAATGIEPTGTAESVAAQFVSWLAETSQPWLVVLDDLPHVDELDGLWPEGPAGRLVITSTQSTVAAGRRRTRVFPVGFFSVREGLSCLTDRLSVNPVQRQGAIDLIEALGREPLALGQAAAVIANSTLACRDYRDFFARRRQQIGVAAGEVPSAASVTWTLSLGQAEQLLPGQSIRPMLVLIALLDGHGIPGTVFSTESVSNYLGGTAARFGTPVDPKPAWDALLIIERAGLISIKRAEGPPTILMSPVVQAAIRVAAPAPVRDRAARAAADALLEAWPIDEPAPWTAAVLRANAANLQNTATDILWANGCDLLLLRAGRSLDLARLVGPAVEYWRELAVSCDNKLPPGHPDALVVAAQLAGAYLAAGYGAEAVAWYQRVLAERSLDLAPGHPAIIAARVSLADALIVAGKAADAVTALRRTVTESEQFRGAGHPDTLAVRDELARALEAAHDVPAAVRLLTQTLAERERLQGARDLHTMATRDQLAAAQLADGKIKQAISGYKRVLADRQAVLGRDHPDTIATKASLVGAFRAAGRIPSAVQLSEQTCTDSERVLGADHTETLARRVALANLYYAAGRLGDAETVLRDTITRCERMLPYGDPLTQTVHQSLASIAGDGRLSSVQRP